jgi:transposase
MLNQETRTLARHLFYAEHWKIGTIAQQLQIHADTVRHAIEADRFRAARARTMRASITDPYLPFIRQVLDQYPRLCATPIHQMLVDRGYSGSATQLRRVVATLRPSSREPFLRLQTFPAEQGQVDWAHFGEVAVGQARRRLSGFVALLSYSRDMYLEFFFEQVLENFLGGLVHAFQHWQGVPRVLVEDNLRSAVLERRGTQIVFHPRLLELCAHYHCIPRPCQVRAPQQKGRVERAIRFVRESFWAGRSFTTLPEFNRQAEQWCEQVANRRRWPGDDRLTVAEAFAQEQPRLLPLPAHPFNTDRMLPVRAHKTLYVRFDLNDYSIPPEAVGRPLTLVASDKQVRILDGTQEIARHLRSYDRRQEILDPAHAQAVLELKRRALASTAGGRLAHAVPESEALLDAAFARGESAAQQTLQLLKLLDLYGVEALRRAIRQALERDTPRSSSVAFLLRQQAASSSTPPPVDLSRHPEAQAIDLAPHDLETYDELAHHDDAQNRNSHE